MSNNVKITAVHFRDKFNTFGLRAAIEHVVSDGTVLTTDISQLNLIYTKPVLDVHGNAVMVLDEEFGDMIALSEEVPYEHVVSGKIDTLFIIDQEDGTICSNLIGSSSKELDITGFGFFAFKTNKRLSPADRMCKGMWSMHGKQNKSSLFDFNDITG